MADSQQTTLRDYPAWVLERYVEAKELLEEMQGLYALPSDLSASVDDWLTSTMMDTCTTCGPDCACNEPYREAIARGR